MTRHRREPTYRAYAGHDLDAGAAWEAFQAGVELAGWMLVDFLKVEERGPWIVRALPAIRDARPATLGGMPVKPEDFHDALAGRYFERRRRSPDAEWIDPQAVVYIPANGDRYHALDGKPVREVSDARGRATRCGMKVYTSPKDALVPAIEAWDRDLLLCGNCKRATI